MKKFNPYTSATVSSILLAVMVVLAEINPSFKDFLAATFSHHWVGKSVIVTFSFLIAGFVYPKSKLAGYKLEDIAWYSTLVSLAIVFLFYLIHYLA